MSGTKSPSRKAPVTDENTAPIEALIVAHGQPSDPDPAEEVLSNYVAQIQAALPGHVIGGATMAAPGKLEAQLARLEDGGVIYPLFMADGWFVRTALVNRISDAALDVVVSIIPPYGLASNLPEIAARSVRDKMQKTGADKLLIAAHGSAYGDAPRRQLGSSWSGCESICRMWKWILGFWNKNQPSVTKPAPLALTHFACPSLQ